MHRIIIQYATDKTFIPKAAWLRQCAKKALSQEKQSMEVTIRIVGIEEMTMLNSTYRHKSGPTNILSFPFEAPVEANLKTRILGDMIICADVVNQEAKDQHKSETAHWAHMVVHGILHLLGYDHEIEAEAEVMEALEIKIMRDLDFPNPYESGENIKHYG